MKRSLMQAYVKGSGAAVELYREAFGAEVVSAYVNDDGTYYHSELDVYGQILSVSEARGVYFGAGEAGTTGSTMQFCLHFAPGEEAEVQRAYGALKAGADILMPLGPCDYSPLMADLVDRFGVRWCIFVSC